MSKEYICIKSYPGVQEGTKVFWWSNGKYKTEKEHIPKGEIYSNEQIENNPEYWQKVKKKEYEILQWSMPFNQIISIKRLSDGEVFTVGDSIQYYSDKTRKIKEIICKKEDCADTRLMPWLECDSGGQCLRDAIKVKEKPILFTTEDGVQIKEGDTTYYVGITYEITIHNNVNSDTKRNYYNLKAGDNGDKCKHFSTQEAAQEYVLLNKPCLSINEVKERINRSLL